MCYGLKNTFRTTLATFSQRWELGLEGVVCEKAPKALRKPMDCQEAGGEPKLETTNMSHAPVYCFLQGAELGTCGMHSGPQFWQAPGSEALDTGSLDADKPCSLGWEGGHGLSTDRENEIEERIQIMGGCPVQKTRTPQSSRILGSIFCCR